MTEVPKFPNRHAISRARFFLQRAKACVVTEREEFECYLDAATLYGGIALNRLISRYEKHPEKEKWLASIQADPAVDFFRDHRNYLVHDGPLPYGQVLFGGYDGATDDTSNPVVTRATQFYYFVSGTPATETVRPHLESLALIVADAEELFQS